MIIKKCATAERKMKELPPDTTVQVCLRSCDANRLGGCLVSEIDGMAEQWGRVLDATQVTICAVYPHQVAPPAPTEDEL